MKNLLSIDVEELFHAEYASVLRKHQKAQGDFGTEHNLLKIVKMLDEYGAKATFFVVGEVAERCPVAMKVIIKEGHEIAFHSYNHTPLWKENPERLKKEIELFNDLLLPIAGNRCMGFRAPSFSLDNKTVWALDVLRESGMLYDSSVFPAWTPLYGVVNAFMRPYKPSGHDLTAEDVDGELWEFPLTVYSYLL